MKRQTFKIYITKEGKELLNKNQVDEKKSDKVLHFLSGLKK
ncbi:hypothetical protein [Metabacillus sp. Hm71]